MSVEYLRKEHKTDAETFAWPRVPRLPFYHCKCLCKEGAEQRLQRLEITLLSFFIFFFSKMFPFLSLALSTRTHERPQVLGQSSCMETDCDARTCSVWSLRVQAGAADSAPKQRPDKQKARQINFVHCGHTSARCIADCSADSRYRRGCTT